MQKGKISPSVLQTHLCCSGLLTSAANACPLLQYSLLQNALTVFLNLFCTLPSYNYSSAFLFSPEEVNCTEIKESGPFSPSPLCFLILAGIIFSSIF